MAWSQSSTYCDEHDFSDYDREDNGECGDCCSCTCADDDRCTDCASCCAPEGSYREKLKPITHNTKTGGNVNRTIAKLFEKTADAVLVNKFYGHQIADNDVEVIRLQGKQKELLAAAQAKQDEQDKHANVVNARVCE